MIAVNWIFADLQVALGATPYQADCIETFLLVFLGVPVVLACPYLLAQWDAYKRADNARRRAAQKRRMERTARG